MGGRVGAGVETPASFRCVMARVFRPLAGWRRGVMNCDPQARAWGYRLCAAKAARTRIGDWRLVSSRLQAIQTAGYGPELVSVPNVSFRVLVVEVLFSGFPSRRISTI